MAFAFGFVPMEETPPIVFKIVFGLLGLLAIYGGLHHLRFLFMRRLALSGGRERKGTLQLRGDLDDDSAMAHLLFSTSYGQWLLMFDPKYIRGREEELRKGISALATVGEDERVYGLKIGGKDIIMQSAGIAFEGTVRDLVEKAEKRLAVLEKKHSR